MYRCLITALCLSLCVVCSAAAKPAKSTLQYLEASKGQFPAADHTQRDVAPATMTVYETQLPPASAGTAAKETAAPVSKEVPAALPPPKARAGGPQRVDPRLADTLTSQYVSESGLQAEGYAQPANPQGPENPKAHYDYRYPELRNSGNGLYVAAFGGITPLQNYQDASINFDKLVPGSGEFPYDTKSKIGPVAGAKVGYQFDPIPLGPGYEVGTPGLRPVVEFEGMYVKFRSSGDARTSATIPSTEVDAEHNVQLANFSVNGIARFELGKYFHPYLGVGVGGAYAWSESEVNVKTKAPLPPGSTRLDGYMEELVFSAQGIAGAEVRINRHWGIFTEYKFLYLPTLDIEDDTNEMNLEDLGLHLVTGGIRYSF
jgi:opacity protein-like surface antigen